MTSSERDWLYVSESRIQPGGNIVVLPEELTEEADILTAGADAAFAYDRAGLVVVSNRKLVDSDYKYIDTNGIDADTRAARVPGRFFDDFGGHRGPIEEPNTEYDPRFEYGQSVYFAFYEGMDEGDTRSCYMLTQKQLMDIMNGKEFTDSFGTPPRFL